MAKLVKTSVQLTPEQHKFLNGYLGLSVSQAIRFILDCEMQFGDYKGVVITKVKG